MAKWYFLIDGEEFGPVESAVLRRIADSGRLKPDDKVRREDMSEWEWFQAKQVKGLFAAAQSTATAGSTPIPNAEVKQNAAAKMPPPAPISASYPGASGQPTSQQSSPVSRSSFGPWYRARLGKLPIILQVILWWFYGFIWIPIWWLVSRNEMSALPSKSGVAFASGDRAVKPTSKPAFNSKWLIATLGIVLFLLVLLIPAIQSARDAVRRKEEQERAKVESLLASARQTLSDNSPVPVQAALASGKEVWALNDYLPAYLDKMIPNRPYTFYIIMTGDKLERGIFAADRVGARYEEVNLDVKRTEKYGTSTSSYRTGNKLCISTQQWFLDVHMAPEKRATETTIFIDPDKGEGSWTREHTTTANTYDLSGGKFTRSGTEAKENVTAGKAFIVKM